MRFWVFGDSFAMDHANPQQWMHQLARHYRTELIIDAYYGYSNERIFLSVENHLSQFDRDDWIIVVGTQENRHWFFPDLPEYSNWLNMSKMDQDPLTAEQHTALELYGKHLLNTTVDAFNHYCQTVWLDTVSKQQDLNLIYLPGFANTSRALVPGRAKVRGTLTESVSQAEFESRAARLEWYKTLDSRHNHLSAHNHSILASKIKNVIDSNSTLIDLEEDFEQGFITLDSAKRQR